MKNTNKYIMYKNFEDQIFLICGGSGHLGSALIRSLLELDAKVINLSSKSINDKNILENDMYTEFILDLNEIGSVKDVERNLLKLGQFKISGIVNFASRSTRGLNLESSLEELVETYKGVIAPTWNSILVFKKYIISGGSIINLGSIWGLLSPDPRVYLDMGNEPAIGLPGAKSAVIQISKYLSVLLAPDKIRVNCVVPGWFPAQRGMSRPDYVEGIKRRVPTNKIGTSDELVTSFLYLLDLNSSYTTGQTLIVDGGFSIW